MQYNIDSIWEYEIILNKHKTLKQNKVLSRPQGPDFLSTHCKMHKFHGRHLVGIVMGLVFDTAGLNTLNH